MANSTLTSETTTVTLRVPVAMKERLEALAKATGRSKSFLGIEALEAYLDAAGLIVVQEDGYGRSKATKMTTKGKTTLKAAFPLWCKAQEDAMRSLAKIYWTRWRSNLKL